MKSILLFIISSILLILLGCASPRSISVSNLNAVDTTYEQGVAVLKSVKSHAVVLRVLSTSFSNETRELPALLVGFANGRDHAIDFSTQNISCRSGDRVVKVYNFEELEKKIKKEAALLAFALAMNSASQSMAASMPQHTYSSGTVSAYGSGGFAHGSYSGYSTTYNPAASAAAQAQINANTMNMMTAVASSRNIQLNSLSSMLRRNTVGPGEFVSGVVKLHAEDIVAGQPLRLVVSLGSENHEFIFDISKR